jgi:hypothetical protein
MEVHLLPRDSIDLLRCATSNEGLVYCVSMHIGRIFQIDICARFVVAKDFKFDFNGAGHVLVTKLQTDFSAEGKFVATTTSDTASQREYQELGKQTRYGTR